MQGNNVTHNPLTSLTAERHDLQAQRADILLAQPKALAAGLGNKARVEQRPKGLTQQRTFMSR